MKRIILYSSLFLLLSAQTMGQESNPANTVMVSPEQGVQFKFNEGAYQFELGGFIQPSWRMIRSGNEPADNYLSARRAFFRIAGEARDEKVSFLIQTNISESQPLLDAWVAWHPQKQLTITMGQKQTFANNMEMRYREDRLQFTDRSALSTDMSASGREFGVFVEGVYGEKFGVSPMLAITSGDGRNSFGVDSRDTDIGGLKYAARLDLFPLGYFSEGNELYSADLMHEPKPKIMIGSAWSLNKGVSSGVGEGHGDFMLFSKNGDVTLPDYSQIYVDLLLKYKGFSFLFEFANASTTGLSSNFLDINARQRLAPQQISSLLVLGNSFNTQVGYVTKSGYSFDVRYGSSSPEFNAYTGGLLPDVSHSTLGFTRYFSGHHLKAQAAYSILNSRNGNGGTGVFELLMQVAF